MNAKVLSKRLLMVAGILVTLALILYLLGSGWGSGIVTVIGLALAIGAMVYLKKMENQAERNIAQRIKAEYPSESQSQVFAVYQQLKIKELEGLFLKILDDAHGDLSKVKKLAGIAESVGWKAFLENNW